MPPLGSQGLTEIRTIATLSHRKTPSTLESGALSALQISSGTSWGNVAFEDLETGERLSGDVPEFRAGHLADLRRFLAELSHGCRDHSIDYALIDTAHPFDTALSAYLAHRRGMVARGK